MKTDQSVSHKPLDYGVGALAVLVASVGVAVIVYSLNVIPLVLFNIPAWIFGPLGVYTLAFSFVARQESTYYMVWGTVMSAVGVISGFYNVINPFLVVGILAIVIAIIGIVAYQRSKK